MMTTATETARTYTFRVDGYDEDVDVQPSENVAEALEAWVREGTWDASRGTVFVSAWAFDGRDGRGEQAAATTVTIQPDEPECEAAAHDWAEESVRGHGGGVVVVERCSHCGCSRTTDTWATNPSTGEQGLTSVSYEEPTDDEDGWDE